MFVTLPIDLVFGKHTEQEPKSLPDYVEDFINRIENVHEVVRDRLMNSAERQKRRYDISLFWAPLVLMAGSPGGWYHLFMFPWYGCGLFTWIILDLLLGPSCI
jgi:hypothetical protein